MSLRGFQLFHLRSKGKKRLLLLPLFSLTFYTVTSFDRGWGRGENKIASERLIILCRLQQYSPLCLAETMLCFCSSCIFVEFLFLSFVLKTTWYVSWLSNVTWTRQGGSLHVSAVFLSDGCLIFPQSYCKLSESMLGTYLLTQVGFLLCLTVCVMFHGIQQGVELFDCVVFFFLSPFHLLNSQITSKSTLDAWR